MRERGTGGCVRKMIGTAGGGAIDLDGAGSKVVGEEHRIVDVLREHLHTPPIQPWHARSPMHTLTPRKGLCYRFIGPCKRECVEQRKQKKQLEAAACKTSSRHEE